MYEFIYEIDNPISTTDPEPDPCQHFEVHCSRCNWWGMLTNLKPVYKSNPAEPGDVLTEPGCPMCLSDYWLEYEED